MTEDETNELLWLREQKRRPEPSRAAISKQHVEEPKDDNCGGIGSFKRRTWVLFSVMGGLIYGYNVSLAATLQYMRDDLELSSTQEEALSATATLSDASSMLLGGYLADRFGRKATAMFACCCSIVGAILAGLGSSNFQWLVLWRLCSGVGNGLSILLIPMYISECVDAASRGAFLTLFQLGVNSGVAVPYLFMIAVSENWRACLASGSLPALYVLYNFHFHFPESIKWLRWKENPATDLEDGPTDLSDEDSVDTVVSVLFAARFVIARFSRRQVYLICLVVVCGCFVVSGAIFARYSTDDFARSSAASASIMATFAVLNVFAAVGPSILFVVILSELFQDNSYRARYMSYCTFAMSLISLLMNGSMLTLFETFGTATTFLAYGASYVVCLVFFWQHLPETKQRQLV
ncbi:hypothetical protein BBJ29_006846 [Phytophthora kernoviae]|uniref:Major facilitator superfamily (MFS) profile domain-containing protein n=1 Tax=Phytophthora kernoviae TaxID=325452 RepID=A0A3F2RU01_9STRA|nr:hypothetical protein BBJ29_006846 [Phytophthora kernoviae]RLN64216.1 hypothetical protein BBP00_00003613 [Phytophthora kernoviae]